MKYYNEKEQSWRKLKQDHPDVANAIEQSDDREYLGHGRWRIDLQTTPCDDLVYRAPIQNEAEKFLEKWGGKKIWQEGMWRHSYHLVTGVMDHNRVYIKDQDGKCGHIVLRAVDNWQLWESPIKLDTRKVAGWWVFFPSGLNYLMCSDVGRCGLSLKVSDTWINIDNLKCAVFSKDPMKPLDQWQTLEQICGGES